MVLLVKDLIGGSDLASASTRNNTHDTDGMGGRATKRDYQHTPSFTCRIQPRSNGGVVVLGFMVRYLTQGHSKVTEGHYCSNHNYTEVPCLGIE